MGVIQVVEGSQQHASLQSLVRWALQGLRDIRKGCSLGGGGTASFLKWDEYINCLYRLNVADRVAESRTGLCACARGGEMAMRLVSGVCVGLGARQTQQAMGL